MTKNTSIPLNSLQDLIDQLKPGKSFTSRRCRDIRSSVNTLAKLLQRTADKIPASTIQLNNLFEKHAPQLKGITNKRWQNIRCDIRALIKSSDGRSPNRMRLSDEWIRLKGLLPSVHLRNSLSGFITYCNASGIDAETVNDRVVSEYHRYLAEKTFRKKPNAVHRSTCKSWNQAVDEVFEWPKNYLTLPNYRKPRFTLDWAEVPTTLKNDVDKYLAWLSGKSFDEDPPTNLHKPTTIQLLKRQLESLIAAATPQQDPQLCPSSLRELVEEASLREIATFYMGKCNGERSPYLQDLMGVLLRVAKNRLKSDDEVLDRIRKYRSRMGKAQPGLTPKNRRTLLAFQDPSIRRKLLDLPAKLDQASFQLQSQKRQSVRRQLALAINLLLCAPMRSGNLVSLNIDENISGLGNAGGTFIVIDAEKVKNNQPLIYPLPSYVAEQLQRYLHIDQPMLGGLGCPWLFPGKNPVSHKEQKTLAQQLEKIIWRHVGIRITPHQFRHLAASIILDDQPGAYPLVQRVLGHKSMKTTANFYSGQEMAAAVKSYDSILRASGA